MKDPEWAKKEAERQREKTIKRTARFPEKTKAYNACKPLRRKSKLHLHHWSYLDEHQKDVFPMTIPDHRLVHCYMKYDAERMMYRRVDTMELLDSREKAAAFYESILNNQPNQ